MKAQFVYETLDFERGRNPKKALDIGKEAIPVYRCGRCGSFTDINGKEYDYDSPEFTRSQEIDKNMQGETTEDVECDDCISQLVEWQEEEIAEEKRREEEERRWYEENGPEGHGW